MLSALLLAFLFTLSFQGIVGIYFCYFFADSTEISTSFPNNVSWKKVDTWNAEVVDVPYLLLTMLSALLLAFLFTLSFRGIVGIYFCYFFAVAVVAFLSLRV